MKNFFLTGVSALAIAAPFNAWAQDAGLAYSVQYGIEYGDFSTISADGFNSEELDFSYRLGFISANVGYDFASDFFVGASLSYGIGLGDGPDNGVAGVESISRGRVVGGYSFGNFDVYAAAGYGEMRASVPGNIAAQDYEGQTYALGMDYAFSDMGSLSVELIRDEFDSDEGSKGPTEATGKAVRIATKFEF